MKPQYQTIFNNSSLLRTKLPYPSGCFVLILIELRFRLGFVEEVANVKKNKDLNRQMEKILNADKPTEGCQTKSNHNSSYNSSHYFLHVALMSK